MIQIISCRFLYLFYYIFQGVNFNLAFVDCTLEFKKQIYSQMGIKILSEISCVVKPILP